MKRIYLCSVLFILFLTTAIAFEDSLPMVWGSVLPITDSTQPKYDDDRDYDNFSGRLYIDDVNIDVALYNSNDQEAVDRKDSAAYFDLSVARGKMLIADHNTHAFGTLSNVNIGTIARIEKEDGTTVYYKCVDIFNGHNTGKGITDWNGNSVVGKADLLMYTCFDGWQNVVVTLWDEEQEASEDVMTRMFEYTQNIIERMLPWHASITE